MDKQQLELFAKIFGCSVKDIEADIEDLVNKGLMQKDDDGGYSLTDKGETLGLLISDPEKSSQN